MMENIYIFQKMCQDYQNIIGITQIFYLKKDLQKKGDLVIEIASNDGILLQHLKNKVNILGIDAAPNAVLRALKFEIPTFPSLFNFKTSKLVKNEFGAAKVLMANQCIAHVDDLRDFMKGVDNLLDKKWYFVFETGYWEIWLKELYTNKYIMTISHIFH